jgi:hypothetical protein
VLLDQHPGDNQVLRRDGLYIHVISSNCGVDLREGFKCSR